MDEINGRTSVIEINDYEAEWSKFKLHSDKQAYWELCGTRKRIWLVARHNPRAGLKLAAQALRGYVLSDMETVQDTILGLGHYFGSSNNFNATEQRALAQCTMAAWNESHYTGFVLARFGECVQHTDSVRKTPGWYPMIAAELFSVLTIPLTMVVDFSELEKVRGTIW